MAVFRDPAKLLAHQRARASRALRSVAEQTRFQAEEGRADAVAGTSGTVSSEQLAKMGHPFGRGPSAAKNFEAGGNVLQRRRMRLLPINRQSGRLRASIALTKKGQRRYDVAIGQGVEYARFILHPAGTRKMVGRGLMGWRDRNPAFPAGLLERRHRLRTKAWRDALRIAHRKP